MVAITVVNNLSADMTVAGTTVSGGSSAVVDVGNSSFSVVTTAQWSTTYSVPLLCEPGTVDAGNACSYTNPPNAVWSFQAPLPNARVPTGFLIGSVDGVGAYTLVAGTCQVQVTADAALLALVSVTVTANVATDAALVLNAAPVQLKTSAAKVTVKFTNSAAGSTLDTTYTSPMFITALQDWVTDPFPQVTTVTYNLPYAAKQVASVTLTMNQTTMIVHLALPGGSNGLGFQFESFHYPPLQGSYKQRTNTLGFYSELNFTNSQFLPEAPFFMVTSAATVVPTYVKMSGTPPTLTTVVLSRPSLFAFRACAPVSKPAYQLLWLTDTSPNGSWYVFDSNMNLSVDMAAACAQGQWGLFQVWDSTSNAYTGAVAFAYQPAAAGSDILWLNNGSGTSLLPKRPGLYPTGIVVNSPIGFVSNVAADYTFKLYLAQSDSLLPGGTDTSKSYSDDIPAPYYETCWNSIPPIAAFGGKGTSGPGGPMCDAPPAGAATTAYDIGKRRYVTDVCLGETADCMPVAGTVSATCVGWIGQFTNQYCHDACTSSVGANLSAFCDQSKIAYCEASDAHANSAECSCIKVDTSSFPAATRWGMSYPQFVNWITATYGVTANTSLNPQCWWDTCVTNPGMTLSDSVLSCPTTLNSCVNLVKNLTVDTNSSVRLKMVNDCRISSDTKDGKPTPCASLGDLSSQIGTSNSPFETTATPGQFTIFEQVLLGLTGIATLIMVMCTIAAVVTKIKKSEAFK
jgi:hypothetical protein